METVVSLPTNTNALLPPAVNFGLPQCVNAQLTRTATILLSKILALFPAV